MALFPTDEQIDARLADCKSCRRYLAFTDDIRRCRDACTMGGLPMIRAEDTLCRLVAQPLSMLLRYVNEEYVPGALNPFSGTALDIK